MVLASYWGLYIDEIKKKKKNGAVLQMQLLYKLRDKSGALWW
jgi:hypothetical protein